MSHSMFSRKAERINTERLPDGRMRFVAGHAPQIDPKDLEAARRIVRAHKKPWRENIDVPDDYLEPMPVAAKIAGLIFLAIVVGAALLPVVAG